MKKTITTKEDVVYFVDEFYKRIRAHEVLGPVFNDEIGNLWFLHLDTLSRFWETLLLGNRTYFGDPFEKHLKIPIKNEHFDLWIPLFLKTVDDLFEGNKAEEAKLRGQNLARSFRKRLAKAGTLVE
ncbi:group III truncated hemoglobin [Wenyingzhuangia sp. IMCC45574]